jgi:hypothetical protein
MKKNDVIDYLKNNKEVILKKKAMIGIDGFVDKIIRPVKTKDSDNNYTFFSTIAEFGGFVTSKAGMSCGIQVRERFTKLGGNAPIMASALCATGLDVDCVAALGYPTTEPIFDNIGTTCTMHTVGNPGYTTAIEFEDGKVMLNQRDALHAINWATFKTILGLDKMKAFFDQSDIIGLVNWNAMIHFNEIMRGILDDILIKEPIDKTKLVFFDTADISERTSEDVLAFIELAKEFNIYRKVILGVNANEAILFYKTLFPNKIVPDIKTIGDELYTVLNCDILVIHTLFNALAWEKDHFSDVPSLYVRKPKLSTGGGDNFNAGLCFGFMIGLDLEGALYTANATSGSYVRNAESPSYEKLIETLENWDSLLEKPE